MPRSRPVSLALRCLATGSLVTLVAGAAPPPVAEGWRTVPPPSSQQASTAPTHRPPRWTDETPDAMVADAAQRAIRPGASEADILAAALVVAALTQRAAYGLAERALRDIAAGVAGPLSSEIALLARESAADEGAASGTKADADLGVVTELALLGPFHDTGGGLDVHDGPEGQGASFADTARRYSWGTVDVSWRVVPPHYATARGVPLDLFVSPRTESCSLVASVVTAPRALRMVVRVAAAGSARLIFDGVDVARSEEVETSARVDRLAVEVDATPGPHLVAVKVCSGALADDGRVRVRLTDPSGAPLVLPASSDLTILARAAASAPGRPEARPVETPLARTLHLRAGGPDPQIDSAVARTLGGADDARSPRAAGLLDGLARSGKLSPDALAMVGWITPSGASRSGLLARAAGLAAGVDPLTSAFTARRLIVHRIEAQLPDWAASSVYDLHLGIGDAEAVLIRALVQDASGIDGLRTEALASLARFSASRPDSVPTALLHELADLARRYDRARERAVRDLLAQRGELGHELVSALGGRGGDDVARGARSAFDGHLADAADGLAIADALSRAGRHADALAAYTQMTVWSPNSAEAWAGLAHELSFVGGEAHEKVADALRRARDLAPSDASLRAEAMFRQSGSGRAADATEDERYLVAPEVFLARRQGVPASGAPDVADRELHWMRAVVLHPDRRVSQLVQYAREVVIPPRTQADLVESLPAVGDLTELIRARVYRRDGSVSLPAELDSDDSGPMVRWPDLQPGDTVEVVVRGWTSQAVGGRGDPPFSFVDYVGGVSTHPLSYNEVVVESPTSAPIYLDVLHGVPDRREERDVGDRHVTRLVWDHPVAVPDEPLAPHMSEVTPVVVGSTFKDWRDFGAWYEKAVEGFTVPDQEVRTLAADLTQGKQTREARVAAIFNYVADDIRYVNFTSAEAWLPNRPQQLLARREGDCDDKATLLIALLSAIGVQAEQVMVQTRELGQPSLLLSKQAAIPYFDHGIAFLPGPGGGRYLDATNPSARIGPLPSMDARALALRLHAGAMEITRLPAGSPRDHGKQVSWTVKLHEDGSGDLVGEEAALGDAAFWLRRALAQSDSRAAYVRDELLAPWLPTFSLQGKIDFDGERAQGGARVRYGATVTGLVRVGQGEMVVDLDRKDGLTGRLAPLLARTLPVVLPAGVAPGHEDRTVRLTAPPGFAWASLPSGGEASGGKFGDARLAVARDAADPRTLVVRQSLVIDQDLIPVEEYGAWRAWLRRVDRLMRQEIRLLPTATARAGR